MAPPNIPIGGRPPRGGREATTPRGTNPAGQEDTHGDGAQDLPPYSPSYRKSDTNARIDLLLREDRQRRRTQTLFPYLFARAVPGDRGARPLWPPTVCWESCDIHLIPVGPGGFDFARTILRPVVGQSYRVFVHVWNLGRFAAYGARLRVWWIQPGFFNGTTDPRYQPHFIGGTYFDLGDRASGASHRLIEVPTPWTPVFNGDIHECLVAAVECATDPWDGVIDCNNRRHVAQRNLDLLQGTAKLSPALAVLGGAVSPEDKELLITHASVQRTSLAGARERGLAESGEPPDGFNHGGLRLANDDRPIAVIRQNKGKAQFFDLAGAKVVPRPGARLVKGKALKGELRAQLPALLANTLRIPDLTAATVAGGLGSQGEARVLRFVLTGPKGQTGGYSIIVAP
jgi:hypothetical protein